MTGLVVFIIPSNKDINGGILSIFSLCKESRRFNDIHKADILVSVPPGNKTYGHNDYFENSESIYDFEKILKKYPKPSSLIINIPEYMVADVYESLYVIEDYLASCGKVHINILNQNDELMPSTSSLLALYYFSEEITITTAHIRYSNQEKCNQYGVPLHLFSVSIDPSNYNYTGYDSKEDIIVLSPDKHPIKSKLAGKLVSAFPNFKIIEIKNMAYEDYKKLIEKAKFAITFGEGFDSYLIEPAFAGGITFAVYNDVFFPSNSYAKLKNIYSSYEEMLSSVVSDMKKLDSEAIYKSTNAECFSMLKRAYSYDQYVANIKRFYQQNYSYTPSDSSALKLISADYAKSEHLVKKQGLKISDLEVQLVSEKQNLKNLKNSASWKATKPLRKTKKLLRKISSK